MAKKLTGRIANLGKYAHAPKGSGVAKVAKPGATRKSVKSIVREMKVTYK